MVHQNLSPLKLSISTAFALTFLLLAGLKTTHATEKATLPTKKLAFLSITSSSKNTQTSLRSLDDPSQGLLLDTVYELIENGNIGFKVSEALKVEASFLSVLSTQRASVILGDLQPYQKMDFLITGLDYNKDAHIKAPFVGFLFASGMYGLDSAPSSSNASSTEVQSLVFGSGLHTGYEFKLSNDISLIPEAQAIFITPQASQNSLLQSGARFKYRF